MFAYPVRDLFAPACCGFLLAELCRLEGCHVFILLPVIVLNPTPAITVEEILFESWLLNCHYIFGGVRWGGGGGGGHGGVKVQHVFGKCTLNTVEILMCALQTTGNGINYISWVHTVLLNLRIRSKT